MQVMSMWQQVQHRKQSADISLVSAATYCCYIWDARWGRQQPHRSDGCGRGLSKGWRHAAESLWSSGEGLGITAGHRWRERLQTGSSR